MATELKQTSSHRLTQFHGGNRGQCLQVTHPDAWRGVGGGYISVNQGEALELAEALIQWVRGTREESTE